MSTLWTPSGEYEPTREPPDATTPSAHPGDADAPPAGAAPPPDQLSPEELQAVRRLHSELRSTAAADVVANHAVQIFQLALIYLGVATPPDEDGRPPVADLTNAGFAIDAMAALVDGLGPRLAEHEAPLRDGISQLHMLFARIADHSDPETS